MPKTIPPVTLATHLALVAVACDIVGTDAYTGSITLPMRISLSLALGQDLDAARDKVCEIALALGKRFGSVDWTIAPRHASHHDWTVTFWVDLV
jgi:hypothetical protein